MKLDDALRDLLRERGADEDMLKWLEEPEAVRKAFRVADEWGPVWVSSLWMSSGDARAVAQEVDRERGVITITTTGDEPTSVESDDRVRPVDRRPYPVRMAEKRARRRAWR